MAIKYGTHRYFHQTIKHGSILLQCRTEMVFDFRIQSNSYKSVWKLLLTNHQFQHGIVLIKWEAPTSFSVTWKLWGQHQRKRKWASSKYWMTGCNARKLCQLPTFLKIWDKGLVQSFVSSIKLGDFTWSGGDGVCVCVCLGWDGVGWGLEWGWV